MSDAERLATLVTTSSDLLHRIPSRSDAHHIAAELDRLNRSVRDLARGAIGPSDQPGDFAAALLRHADATNG
jgi:hypothetical protein